MEENMNEVDNIAENETSFIFSLQVSAIIANLRNVANDINNTTKAQNQMLERIHKKDDSDIQRVGEAVKKAGELMG